MARSKKRWVRVVLPLAAIILLGSGAFLLYWSGVGEQGLRVLGQWVNRLEGIQVLASQLGLDLGTTTPADKAIVWIQRGAALEGEGRYQEAQEAYETALEIAPDQPLAYYGLASVYESLGQIDLALVQMEQAVEVAPDDAAGYRHLGRLQCMNGQLDACVKTLQQAVEMDPESMWGHYFLATAYRQSSSSSFEQAQVEYRRVLEMDPDVAEAHLGLAYLYLGQPGKEVLALEAFQEALDAALKAGDENLASTARAELAYLYYAQDNYTRCIEEWRVVLETDPENAVAHRRLGLCYAMRRDEGDLEQAIDELEQALELSFGQVDAYYFYLGQYHATQEEYAQAVWAWEQFLRFSNNDVLNAEVQKWIDQLRQ